MALEDVEFSDEDIEDIVEPFLDVVDAFSDAVFTTLVQAFSKDQATKEARKTVRKEWRIFGDKALRFLKVVDNG